MGRPGRGAAAQADRVLGDRVVEVVAEGDQGARRREDVEELANLDPSTDLRLLPAFDPYTLSLQKEAEPLLPLARRPLVSRTAGWISQVVIVGGAVVATWTHEVKKDRLAIEVAPWRRLTKAERTAIDGEAARIGAAGRTDGRARERPGDEPRRRTRSSRPRS